MRIHVPSIISLLMHCCLAAAFQAGEPVNEIKKRTIIQGNMLDFEKIGGSMKKIIGSAIMIMSLTAFAYAEDRALPKPDVLGEESVSMTKGFSSYDTIIINNLDMSRAEYSRVDDEEKAKIESMKPMLNTIFTSTVETELKRNKLFKKIKINAKPEGNELIYNASVDEFNAGSRALTMLVGFGSGKVHIVMTGKFIDAKTGEELASFKDQEAGGFFGSQDLSGFEGKFPAFVARIGTLSTQFIEKLYK